MESIKTEEYLEEKYISDSEKVSIDGSHQKIMKTWMRIQWRFCMRRISFNSTLFQHINTIISKISNTLNWNLLTEQDENSIYINLSIVKNLNKRGV